MWGERGIGVLVGHVDATARSFFDYKQFSFFCMVKFFTVHNLNGCLLLVRLLGSFIPLAVSKVSFAALFVFPFLLSNGFLAAVGFLLRFSLFLIGFGRRCGGMRWPACWLISEKILKRASQDFAAG